MNQPPFTFAFVTLALTFHGARHPPVILPGLVRRCRPTRPAPSRRLLPLGHAAWQQVDEWLVALRIDVALFLAVVGGAGWGRVVPPCHGGAMGHGMGHSYGRFGGHGISYGRFWWSKEWPKRMEIWLMMVSKLHNWWLIMVFWRVKTPNVDKDDGFEGGPLMVLRECWWLMVHRASQSHVCFRASSAWDLVCW